MLKSVHLLKSNANKSLRTLCYFTVFLCNSDVLYISQDWHMILITVHSTPTGVVMHIIIRISIRCCSLYSSTSQIIVVFWGVSFGLSKRKTLSASEFKQNWFHFAFNIPHFIAYLHLAESRSILFLTNKNNIEKAEAHSKTGFSVNVWKLSKTLRRLKRNTRCTLISIWGELLSKWEN